MRNTILAGVAALAFAGSVLSLAPARADDASLPSVGPNDAPAMIKGDKTVVVFITGPNCVYCNDAERLLLARANSVDGVSFAKFTDANTTEGAIAIVSPAAGKVVFRAQGFHPTSADIDAVLSDIAAVAASQNALAAAQKPFKQQMAEVKAGFEAAVKPLRAQIADLKAKADAAAKEFEDKIADLQLQQQTIDAPFEAQLEAEEAKLDNADLAELRSRYATASKAGDQAKMDEIKGQYDAKVKAIQDKIDEIRAAAAAADKSISAESEALVVKANAARKPFEEQIAQVSAQGDTTVAPFRAKAQKIKEDEAAATGELAGKVNAAFEALQAAINAETPAGEKKQN